MAKFSGKTGLLILTLLIFCMFIHSAEAINTERNSTSITAPNNYSGPGDPVKGDKEEQICRNVIKKVINGEDVSSYFTDPFIVMPGFFNYLERQGQALLDSKPTVIIAVPNSKGGLDQYKGGVISSGSNKKCFSSPVFKSKFKRFENAVIRPANADERNYFYALISFEIKGKPLTVAEEKAPAGTPAVHMLMYMENGKIYMIECMLKRAK
ncbi:MAG: hypothetical protein LWY06_06230 [Firmicutes bacterium]|nr:hypothetical protein [Bacillota bacterium]